MFKDFTKIMRDRCEKGGDYPLCITFKNTYIALTEVSIQTFPCADEEDGKVFYCHIIVGDKKGCIDIPVELFNNNLCTVFLAKMPAIVGSPSGKLVYQVWKLMDLTMEQDEWSDRWPKNSMNRFFEQLYNSAKNNFSL